MLFYYTPPHTSTSVFVDTYRSTGDINTHRFACLRSHSSLVVATNYTYHPYPSTSLTTSIPFIHLIPWVLLISRFGNDHTPMDHRTHPLGSCQELLPGTMGQFYMIFWVILTYDLIEAHNCCNYLDNFQLPHRKLWFINPISKFHNQIKKIYILVQSHDSHSPIFYMLCIYSRIINLLDPSLLSLPI